MERREDEGRRRGGAGKERKRGGRERIARYRETGVWNDDVEEGTER
jgi:hypothetical protein